MKFGKKIKLDINNLYKTQYGTVDNKTFKSVYVNFSCWAEPLTEEPDWDKVIKDLKRQIRVDVYNAINADIFKQEKTIIDLDLRTSGIKLNKRSFLSCELTLFVKPGTPFKSPNIETSIRLLCVSLISNVFNINKQFKFHPDKSS